MQAPIHRPLDRLWNEAFIRVNMQRKTSNLQLVVHHSRDIHTLILCNRYTVYEESMDEKINSDIKQQLDNRTGHATRN